MSRMMIFSFLYFCKCCLFQPITLRRYLSVRPQNIGRFAQLAYDRAVFSPPLKFQLVPVADMPARPSPF